MKQALCALLKTRRWPAMLVFGLLLIASATLKAEGGEHQPGGQRLEDRGEIQKLLTDHTLYGRYMDGQSWTEYHSPDRRTAYRENNCTYQGHWWVASGLICFRYNALNDGQPACFRVFRNGEHLDFYFEQASGAWTLNAYSLDRRPGNPEKLPLEGQACVGV